MNLPFSKSLSLRLLAIFVVTSLVAILVLAALFTHGLGNQWKRSIQPHIVQYINYVHNDLGTPPSIDKARELSLKLPVQIYIYDANNQFLSSTNDQALNLAELDFKRIPRRGRNANKTVQPNNALAKTAQIAFNDDGRFTTLLLKQPNYSVYYEIGGRASRWRHNHSLLWAIAAIGSLLLLSFFIIRRQLSPIRKIQAAVAQMSNGKLDARVPVKGRDDLAELGHSINTMADRIQAMLESKRQLLLAISHELRSPLARARVATEMLEDTTNKERIIEDLQEMDALIQDIMESERLQHHAVLNLHTLNLQPLVMQLADNFTPRIQCSLPSTEVIVNADEARLKVLLRNLFNNAIEHGKPVGQTQTLDNDVSVTLRTENSMAVLEVSDKGPGIATDELENVTEPFFRPDASRTRTTGGFGLGLTLAKLIAQAHDGQLEITSNTVSEARTTNGNGETSGTGTTVKVTLPLAQANNTKLTNDTI